MSGDQGRCALCLERGEAESAVFSVEPDSGGEVLSCETCLGPLLTRLFDEGAVVAPAWGVKVYGIA